MTSRDDRPDLIAIICSAMQDFMGTSMFDGIRSAGRRRQDGFQPMAGNAKVYCVVQHLLAFMSHVPTIALNAVHGSLISATTNVFVFPQRLLPVVDSIAIDRNMRSLSVM